MECPFTGTRVSFRSGSSPFLEHPPKGKAGAYFSQEKDIFCETVCKPNEDCTVDFKLAWWYADHASQFLYQCKK